MILLLSHPSNSAKTAEVNAIHSNPADKTSKGKKKGKGKAKADTLKQDFPKTNTDDGSKGKPKYHCLICDNEHYTKDCQRQAEVIRLLKSTQGTLVVLKEPFPSQQTQMVEQPQSSTPFGS